MKKRLCIAVLLSVAGLQAAQKGTSVKTLAGQCGAESASPETIEPRAIQPWTDDEIRRQISYIPGRTPRNIQVITAAPELFGTADMVARARKAVEKSQSTLTQQLEEYLTAKDVQEEAFLKAFNMQISGLVTLLNKINREHGNPENTFGLDGQVRRQIAATLNESREQLARALYNTTKDCYHIDRSLAAAMNLFNPGKKHTQRVQPTAAAYGKSTISRIAAARRAAKAQAAQAAEAATLAAAAAAVASAEQTAEPETTK